MQQWFRFALSLPVKAIFHDETLGLQQVAIGWIYPQSQDAILANTGYIGKTVKHVTFPGDDCIPGGG